MVNSVNERKRIHLLDEVRGIAILCMVLYHGFFIAGETFGYEWGTAAFDFYTPLEPFFACVFIFVCGISCSLSRNNLKRGLKLLAVALGISFVSCVVMPALKFEGAEIYFGILHFLSVCILIYALAEKGIKMINPYAGILVCAVLFPLFSGIEHGTLNYGNVFVLNLPEVLYKTNYLMPFGLYNGSFHSADYFPVFPDIFVFFAGVFAGIHFSEKGFSRFTYEKRAPFFGFIGRHTLIIYILHMPVIFGILYIADLIIR